jgi:hypothetical protein
MSVKSRMKPKPKAKERPLELGSTACGKADVNGDFRNQDKPRPSLHAIIAKGNSRGRHRGKWWPK